MYFSTKMDPNELLVYIEKYFILDKLIASQKSKIAVITLLWHVQEKAFEQQRCYKGDYSLLKIYGKTPLDWIESELQAVLNESTYSQPGPTLFSSIDKFSKEKRLFLMEKYSGYDIFSNHKWGESNQIDQKEAEEAYDDLWKGYCSSTLRK